MCWNSGKESEKDPDENLAICGMIAKYMLLIFNFAFWLVGCALIGLGWWVYIEKEQFDSSDTPPDGASSMFDLALMAAIIIISVGVVVFLIAICGWVGALREYKPFLYIYIIVVGGILVVLIGAACVGLIFKDKLKEKVTDIFETKGIPHYNYDITLTNLIDYIQKKFQCCGIGTFGYKIWDKNIYFNCSATNPSTMKCGVPFSCCISSASDQNSLANQLCGNGAQEQSATALGGTIYTADCWNAIIDQLKQHMLALGVVAVAFCVPPVLGITLAIIIICEINEKIREFNEENSNSRPSGEAAAANRRAGQKKNYIKPTNDPY